MVGESYPVSKSNSVFLDPASCGSLVGYRLRIESYTNKKGETSNALYANIDLTDCSRKIEWSFDEDGIEKIDRAISMLNEFRKQLAAAAKHLHDLERTNATSKR